VGLLENPVDHDWYEPIRRLPLRDRLTVSGSLFLWRKTLPSTAAEPAIHRARVTAPCLDPPAGYITHVCKLVGEMFPKGWDKGYLRAVDSATPTIKSVIEKGRGKGGWRSEGPDRLEYGRACMGESDLLSGPNGMKVRYMDAQCDGKSRAVTVMSAEAQVLKPLHKLIYDRISEFPWLLRGKAKANRFRTFRKVPGEVFVSGDYESATDHLPVTTAEWVLRTIFRGCVQVPLEVQVAALRYLRVTIQYSDGIEVQATRQLMGSLLCFPLLCIQNYLAFRWIFDESVPVRVNGDDIIFRCKEVDYLKWAGFVSSVGLKLSPGKTLVSSSSFSLNSTFFHVGGNVRLVPVVRCTSLQKSKSPYPSALAGTMRGFLEGFRGEIRDELGAWFLRCRAKLIRKSGRSVCRGLAMPASDVMLKLSGLWRRELWYVNSVPSRYEKCLSLCTEGVPLPPPPDRLSGQVELPRGWRRQELSQKPSVRARQRAAEVDFWDEVIESAWGSTYKPRDVDKQYWEDVVAGSHERAYYDWTRKNIRCKPFVAKFITRLTKVKGLRSRLRSKPLYVILSQPRSMKRRTVWARVEEESECLPDPADYMKETVHRKIALVSAMEAPYWPMCTERWLRGEEALAGYVQ